MTDEEIAVRVLAGERQCPHCKNFAPDAREGDPYIGRWVTVCWPCFDILVTSQEGRDTFTSYTKMRK